MSILRPDEVFATLREFRTCELTTIGRDGYPSTWPTSASFEPEAGRFVLTTSIAFPRRPSTSGATPGCRCSTPTRPGRPSRLPRRSSCRGTRPARTRSAHQCEAWRATGGTRSSGGSRRRIRSVATRSPVEWDWYFMRLQITVTPRVVLWWPAGDFAQEPRRLDLGAGEVSHVG